METYKEIYQIHQFDNGIRLIHKQTNSAVAHVGVIVNAGTRDEKENQAGIAHFIEHCIFKGTHKRNARQVSDRLENVGSDFNAYTCKEETVVHASFPVAYYARTIELFDDIIFHSAFPEKEVAIEKEIIIEEIRSYKDSPAELIYDEYEDLLFRNHPLGHNILGTPQSVKKLTPTQALQFIATCYNTDQLVIASVGNIAFEKLVRLCQSTFGAEITNKRTYQRTAFVPNPPATLIKKTNTHQAHCILGNYAYNYNDPKRVPLLLLNNILGGPATNARLNMSIREQNGLAYTVESTYTAYADTGFVGVYIGSEKTAMEKCIALAKKEMRKLCENKLGTLQLSMAKKQLIGQIAVASETNLSEMQSIAKSILNYNEIDTLEETNARINDLTAEEILEVSNEVLAIDQLSMLVYTK